MVRKLKMGMIGGGVGAFIGNIHRMAAALDGNVELVCGAFSSDPTKSLHTANALGIPKSRAYSDFKKMLKVEASLPESERIDFVSIVTPNYLHYPMALESLKYGFHVLSDKPATTTLAEAWDLAGVVKESGLLYGLTYTYTGYPMVKQAKAILSDGRLGNIRKVVVEYSQGWLSSIEDELSKQASWRLDPAQSGISCCMGDIGVHAANLAEYVTGMHISKICSDLNKIVPGRVLDDDGTVLMQFENGAKGVLIASQISVGEENNFRLRVYCEKGSVDWQQMEPNTLWLRYQNKPTEMLRAGVGEMPADAVQAMRTPRGHPEGYIEAFANIYQQFRRAILAMENKEEIPELDSFPGIDEAIRGMAFIENVVKASTSETKWHSFILCLEDKN